VNGLRRDDRLVIKFGGTSVGGGAQFVRAAGIAAGAASDRPVAVVVSAMSGTTDALLGYADLTAEDAAHTSNGATREGTLAELHRTLADRHLAAAREAVAPELLAGVERRVLELLRELVEAIGAADPNGPAARRAKIAVFGERLSAAILAGAISSQGAPASVVAGDPISTDSGFSEAEVDVAGTRERCLRYVAPLLEDGRVAVVPGFVGRSPEGLPTTLGRGGSDLSATVVGRGIGAGEVWIMSDVDGVLDADPRLVPGAALLPELSYREAGDFAELGAKVLHPRTMEPAAEVGMEVLVRNTFNPDNPGTRVTDAAPEGGIRCVALRPSLSVELPCATGHRRQASAVVCIGSPDERDLRRGQEMMHRAGINPIHAGIAAAGLVFVVFAEKAEEALRVLHEGLVTRDEMAAEEVA
jgi:aspartate kinase